MKKFNVTICWVGLVFLMLAILSEIMQGRYAIAIAWLVAVGWCIKSLMEATDLYKMKDICEQAIDTANKAVGALGAALGGKVVCMGTVEVDKDGKPKSINIGKEKNGDGKSDVPGDTGDKKDVPKGIEDAIRGMAKCMDEAMHYIGQGTGEFMVAHNGVELKVNIPEETMREWEAAKRGKAPENPAHENPEGGSDGAQAQA